ncbi:hypothetical protein Y032_0110g135 [Ancylostoma ceylanicum]|uniref:Chloride channel CLIC-like protein 1 n=2 Tax=Ancylostoma ceylanicum TaxID=53326 RepID=A0A016TEK1_9BILA|nr:hypothetical protein Y032_0110g135 [Ancylostoma ceylanicum]
MFAMLFRDAWVLATALFIISRSVFAAHEENYPDDWTDPNDPTYHRTYPHGIGEAVQTGKDAQTCEQYDPTLRLILRQMFRELGIDPLEKTFFSRLAKISLSSLNMKIIGSYLEKETLENELSMREQVRGALHGMIKVYNEDTSVSAWQELLTMAQPWISVLNMMILPPALFFVLRNVMNSRSLLSCIVLVFFIVSMVTTYNRMYQEKLALRMAEAMKRKEDACAPNSLLEQSLEYLSSFVTFRKKSSCVSFIESQTVSIVAEISLLDVFSDVLSNSVFGVLGNLGRHTNRFFREFYENVPLPAMLLMTVTLIFATVRIKTPLFTLEPLLLSTLRYATGSVVQYIDGPSGPPRDARVQDTHRAGIRGNEESEAADSKNRFIN